MKRPARDFGGVWVTGCALQAGEGRAAGGEP